MASIGNLAIVLSANSAPFEGGLAKVMVQLHGFEGKVSRLGAGASAFDRLGASAAGAGQQAGSGLGVAAAAASRLNVAVLAAGASLAALAVTGVGRGVRLAAELETAEVSMGAMLGSADKAKALVGDLQAMAIATPFQTSDLLTASKTLLSFGVSLDKVLPTLRVLGDISSGTGKDLGELAVVFGQVRGAGRLMGQDFNQLTTAGTGILQGLQKHLGKTAAEIFALKEAGRISFADVAAVLEKSTQPGGTFFDQMGKKAETFQGRLSAATESLDKKLGELGRSLIDNLHLKELLDGASLFLDEAGGLFRAFFGDVGDALAKAGIGWEEFRDFAAAAIWAHLRSLGYLVEGLKLLGGAISSYAIAPTALWAASLAKLFRQKELAASLETLAAKARAFGDELLKTKWGSAAEAVDKAFANVARRSAEAQKGVKGLAGAGGSIVEAVRPAEALARALGGVGEAAHAGLGPLEAFGLKVKALAAAGERLLDTGQVPPIDLLPVDFAQGAGRLDRLMRQVEEVEAKAAPGFFGKLFREEGAKKKLLRVAGEIGGAFDELNKFGPVNRATDTLAARLDAFAAGGVDLATVRDGIEGVERAMRPFDRFKGFEEAKKGLDALAEAARSLESIRVDEGVAEGIGKLKKELDSALKSEAWRVFSEAQTPLEKFESKAANLAAMLKRGAIDNATYTRSLGGMLRELEKAAGLGELKLPAPAERGSVEAVSAVNRFRAQAPAADAGARVQATWDRMRQLQELQLREQEALRRAFERLIVPKVIGGLF